MRFVWTTSLVSIAHILNVSQPVCRASGCGNVDNLKLDAAMLEVLFLDPIVFGE